MGDEVKIEEYCEVCKEIKEYLWNNVYRVYNCTGCYGK